MLFKNLERLKVLQPSFISVTMGAMGSNQRNTFEIVQRIEQDYQINGVAHLTCIGVSEDKILESLDQLKRMNIKNLLCLRGDPPAHSTSSNSSYKSFKYASDLVEFVRKNTGDAFSIGVAGYPEGHIECPDKHQDLLHLKKKVDAGAEYILTQLFFNNHDYFDFVERARGVGITLKIIPGIMPVTNFTQLERFTKMCGATIPPAMVNDLIKIKEDSEVVKNYGVEYSIKQCEELLKGGAPGLHFYTLNQSDSVQKIYKYLHLPIT